MLKRIQGKARLHHKLMFSMLLLGLVPVVIMSAVIFTYGKSRLVEDITSDLLAITNDKSHDIEVILQNNLRETILLAQQTEVINALKNHRTNDNIATPERLANIKRIDKEWIKNRGKSDTAREIAANDLSQFLKVYHDREKGRYGEMFVTDRHGVVKGMTNILSDYYQADEQWWQSTYNGGKGDIFIDDRGHDASVGAVVVGFSVPVRDGQNFVGVLKINFRLSKTLHMADLFNTRDYGHALIAREDGYILLETDSVRHNKFEIASEHHRAQTGRVIESYDKDKNILSAHAILETPYPIMSRQLDADGSMSEAWQTTRWHIIMHMDKALAFEPISKLYYVLLLTGSFVVLVAWLTGVRLSKVLSEPIERLHNGIRKVAEGDLDLRISRDNEKGGEIVELSNSFDKMTAHLQDTLISRDELVSEVRQRKQVEEELRISEQRLRETFEQAAVGIAHVAMDGQWLRVNQRLCDIVRYSEAELLEKTSQQITFPADRDTDDRKLQKLQNAEIKEYSLEKRFIRKDGPVVWVNLTVTLAHRSDGSPDHFIMVIEDVSEKRKMKESLYLLNNDLEQRVIGRTIELTNSKKVLESTLAKLYKAEEQMLHAEKMASMGTFAAGIAHELNNPLTGILNYVQYVRDKTDDEKLRGYLEKAEQNTLRAAKVIKNMLSYSRNTDNEVLDVDINDVVKQSIEIIRPELNKEHIAIELDLVSLPAMIKANRDLLEQVFVNLMTNARDAMREHKDKRLTITTSVNEDEVKVQVSDTGDGIPAKIGRQIFDPFFTTKKPGQGTGLGLTLCQRFISNVGGTIRYISGDDQGTTFDLSFPLQHN